MSSKPRLQKTLSGLEFFSFGFGTMVGVGWLVLIDDWLSRGGPAGAGLAFLIGGALLLPVASVYARLVRSIPDAGAEIAYMEGVVPRRAAFAAAWTMVLSYAIVCPWEAVAIGNLLARVLPAMNRWPLYSVGGKTITAPRLAAGVALALVISVLNRRGIRASARFQKATTLALLALSAAFILLGFGKGHPANLAPLFARPGAGGALVSILLTLQIVPYFLTGFESVGKESEEAREGFDPRGFGSAIRGALAAGSLFYVAILLAVALVFPWKELVAKKLGTEAAFRAAFGSPMLADAILVAALLSLLKIFNGNFVAATRLLFGISRRGLLPPALSRIDARFGTPSAAILLMAGFTVAASALGDAILVPVSEVGSLAVGVGWLSACVADLRRSKRNGGPRAAASFGACVSAAIVAMKVLPFVPGSFTGAEWAAFAVWSAAGFALWTGRESRREPA